MMDDSKSQIRDVWESAAPGWAKWEPAFSAGLSDATEALIDMAGVGEGMRVLDLACGAGVQTVAAAKRVGPTGTVVATDISAKMLEHTRRNVQQAGLSNVEVLESAAEDLPDTLEPVDAAISRLGLMLFPAPVEAVRSVVRLLKHGARFAVLVFATPSANRFMAESMDILLRHAGKPRPTPGQPGIFALSGDGLLDRVVAEGGLVDIEKRIVQAPINMHSVSDTLLMMQEAFGAYRAVLANVTAEARAAAWQDVATFLGEFETEDGFSADFEFLIASGSKAG